MKYFAILLVSVIGLVAADYYGQYVPKAFFIIDENGNPSPAHPINENVLNRARRQIQPIQPFGTGFPFAPIQPFPFPAVPQGTGQGSGSFISSSQTLDSRFGGDEPVVQGQSTIITQNNGQYHKHTTHHRPDGSTYTQKQSGRVKRQQTQLQSQDGTNGNQLQSQSNQNGGQQTQQQSQGNNAHPQTANGQTQGAQHTSNPQPQGAQHANPQQHQPQGNPNQGQGQETRQGNQGQGNQGQGNQGQGHQGQGNQGQGHQGQGNQGQGNQGQGNQGQYNPNHGQGHQGQGNQGFPFQPFPFGIGGGFPQAGFGFPQGFGPQPGFFGGAGFPPQGAPFPQAGFAQAPFPAPGPGTQTIQTGSTLDNRFGEDGVPTVSGGTQTITSSNGQYHETTSILKPDGQVVTTQHHGKFPDKKKN